jgi:hypothetical protein
MGKQRAQCGWQPDALVADRLHDDVDAAVASEIACLAEPRHDAGALAPKARWLLGPTKLTRSGFSWNRGQPRCC